MRKGKREAGKESEREEQREGATERGEEGGRQMNGTKPLPAVAVLLTEVTCSHTGAGGATRFSRMQTRGVVVAIVSLAL